MGYPTSSRKVTDNKRYFYSNNPNKRRPNPYIKKIYPRSYSGGYAYHSSADSGLPLHSAPSTPLTQGPPSSKPHTLPQGDAVRPSRYGPITGTKPHISNKSKPPQVLPKTRESRYNPDNEASLQVRSLSGSIGNQERQLAPNIEANKSRYSGSSFSRYNSRGGSPFNTTSHAGSPVLPSNSHYPPWRHGQRSLEPINTEFSYNYQPYHSKSSSSPGFFSRNNKWRSSGPRVSLSGDSGLNNDTYFKGSPYSQRPAYWKYARNKFLNPNLTALGQPQQFPERRHSQGDHRTPSSRSVSNHSEGKSSVVDIERKREPSFKADETRSPEGECERPKSPLQLPDRPVDTFPENTSGIEEDALPTECRGSGKTVGESIVEDVKDDHGGATEEAEHSNTDVGSSAYMNLGDNDENTIIKKEEMRAEKIIYKNMSEEKLDESMVVDGVLAKKNFEVEEKIKVESLIPSSQGHDSKLYTYISDPELLRTSVSDLQKIELQSPYPEPHSPVDGYIFPMKELQMKLWMLKNRTRYDILAEQRYLLKTPIKTFEDYPFIHQNIQDHRQKYGEQVLRSLSSIKEYEKLKKIRLKERFFHFSHSWEEGCRELQCISDKLRSDEVEFNRQCQLVQSDGERESQRKSNEPEKVSNSFRRRNRADFVDDTDMEAVLLQIEPDYKHFRAAARIPPLEINPLERYSFRCQDVNNLVTDKDRWASRLITDGVDNFTQGEHELFMEAFLSQPKKFGKISHIMGGLRSPEECVMHYYRTKRIVDYKGMLLEKTKRRKNSVAKRRRRKEKLNNEFDESSNAACVSSFDRPSPSEKQIEPITPSGAGVGLDSEYIYHTTPGESVHCAIEPNGSPIDNSSNIGSSNQKSPLEQPEREVPPVELDGKLSSSVIEGEQQEDRPPITPRKRPYDASHETDQEYSDVIPLKVQLEIDRPDTNISPPKFTEYPQSESNTARPKASPHDKAAKKKVRNVSYHKSSYWSVKEAQLFPELLKQHGSQWNQISEKLGTKSTTMVRNYYQRNASQNGWKAIVEESDMKRNMESSSSVQQGQILLQAEQPTAPPPVIDGLPSRQVPTLGLFSDTFGKNRQSKGSESGRRTSTQVFATDNPSDSFTIVKTPEPILPPPNLPFVSLHPRSDPNGERKPPEVSSRQWLGSEQVATAPVSAESKTLSAADPRVRIPSLGALNTVLPDLRIVNEELSTEGTRLAPLPSRNFCVNDMLNTKEGGDLHIPPLVGSRPPKTVVPIPSRTMTQQNGPERMLPVLPAPPGGGITGQIPPSNPKSGSISSLLNPISNAELPQLEAETSNSTLVGTLQPNILVEKTSPCITKQENKGFYFSGINFANDPLAALAAVASAPETIASILPKNDERNS